MGDAPFKHAIKLIDGAAVRAVTEGAASETLAATEPPGEARGLVTLAAATAPFLARSLRREADWLRGVWERPVSETLKALLMDARDAGAMLIDDEVLGAAMLRRARRRLAVLTALADLGGVWDLEAATGALTDFAEIAIRGVVDFLMAREAKRGAIAGFDAAAPGFVVLAMGKLGARELNYSSDVDLIVLFDQGRFAPAAQLTVKERFPKATRDLIRLLSEQTEEGYVARVDLRLRPDPAATPVCLSMTAAEHYYEALGRTWERAAHIKARPIAGDVVAGAAYLERLRPFVWRRHLDYAAIEDAAEMLARIRAHNGGGALSVAGQDVKLGAGGIREIELLAQTRQLVRGGRDPSLRSPRTRDALRALEKAALLSAGERASLDAAYDHLRRLEHRLQMIEDQQTHRMPTAPDALERVAAMMGAENWAALEAETRAHMAAVRRVAGPDLDGRAPPSPVSEEAVEAAISALPEPGRVRAIVDGWFAGRLRAARSPRARASLERLTPCVLRRLAAAPDPMQALARFDRFLGGLPAGVQLLALIEANPRLLDLLTEICAAAPRLADYLARRSSVLDAVLDADFFAPPPGAASHFAALSQTLAPIEDYERTLDAARRWAAEKRFQIGVGVLQGVIAPLEAGPAFADVAEACVKALAPQVIAEHAKRHGPPPGGGVAVVALGRLGSREMTASSDLDLIIVYDAAPAEESVGLKPLAASQYYARFTQKLTAALSAPTAEGALYEVDMRLRPSGRAGPLATSLAAFSRYQQEDAWTWEHLALTRARVVYASANAGSGDISTDVEAAIGRALARPRDPEATRRHAALMRAKLAEAQPAAARDPERRFWDVKFAPGGLIDIDFIAQTELLIAGAAEGGGFSADRAVRRLRALDPPNSGLFSEADAATLAAGYTLQTALLQIERVALEGRFDPETSGEGVQAAFLRATNAPSFSALTAELKEAQTRVRAIFEARFEALAS